MRRLAGEMEDDLDGLDENNSYDGDWELAAPAADN
jgi:hypothetical protein